MRSKLAASLEPPLNPDNVLTTPVVIVNEGFFPLYNVRIDWYANDISFPGGGGFTYSRFTGFVPGSPVLEIGEPKTIMFPADARIATAPAPIRADLIVAIYFTPKWWIFGERRKLIHLVGTPTPTGLRLQLQPISDSFMFPPTRN